jgi:uncharacterized protein (TIGR03435 family)
MSRVRILLAAAVMLVVSGLTHPPPGSAQTPAPATKFEVASIRQTPPAQPASLLFNRLQFGPGTSDPSRLAGSHVTLQLLIHEAYDVDYDQIRGPAWTSDQQYDLNAKVPAGTTKDQLKLMLQDLLRERFELMLHRVVQEFPVYDLTVAKTGSKLREDAASLHPPTPGGPDLGPDRNGHPQFPAGESGLRSGLVDGRVVLTGRGVPLSNLTAFLSMQLATITGPTTFARGRIFDHTGLTSKYDFTLEYAGSMGVGAAIAAPAPLAAGGADTPTGGLTLSEALEKQLGLKLTRTTASLDVLVIDSALRAPTEN